MVLGWGFFQVFMPFQKVSTSIDLNSKVQAQSSFKNIRSALSNSSLKGREDFILEPKEPTDINEIATQAQPTTRGAARVLQVLASIQKRLKTTRYQHRTWVRESRGLYAWDCSGMAEWVLKRAAPRTLVRIYRKRPIARDFFRVIERTPTHRRRAGWRRLAKLTDAQPGDVFAWLRPPEWGRGISGHVGFILQSPKPIVGVPNAYSVRIVDATSLPHQNDTRLDSGDGGFGIGTIIFRTDENGEGTHYGWFGTRGGWTAETRIVVGRVYP